MPEGIGHYHSLFIHSILIPSVINAKRSCFQRDSNDAVCIVLLPSMVSRKSLHFHHNSRKMRQVQD